MIFPQPPWPIVRRRFRNAVVVWTLACVVALPAPVHAQATFSQNDREYFLRVEKDSSRYFFENSNHSTGLVKDSSRPGSPASIAATGFGLAVYAVASSRGWTSRTQAYNRLVKTLDFALDHMEHERGFFYHFVSSHNGKRAWGSEVSSIDTAFFIAGALVASEMFSGEEAKRLAQKLYDRVDWNWMLNRSERFSHGWKPESGFLPYYWDSYNELLMLHALALGSRTHAPPVHVWESWDRLQDEYKGYRVVYAHTGSLFTYQFAHAFIDFRNLLDRNINYFDNSQAATNANRLFCMDHAAEYKSYSSSSWGLTACVGPNGYRAYGARPGLALHDGTIAPYGAIASLPFTPNESAEAAKYFYQQHGARLYGKYGFKDAFNIDEDWFADEWLGINQGITVLMIENALDQTVWKYFMELDGIKRWIKKCKL